MAKKLTLEEVKQFIEKNSDCELLSAKYINKNTKMVFRCGCGNIFKTTFDSFKYKNKRQCNECGHASISRKKAFTHEWFIKEVYKKVKNEYTVLGKYKNAKTKTLFLHNECGYKFLMTPDNFLYQGSRCPRCNRPNYDRNTFQFRGEVYELVKDRYSVLGEYTRNDEKVLMKHNLCGYEWEIVPSSFLNGTRCPKCSGNIKNKTTKYFEKEVYDLVSDEYVVLGEYINNKTHILMLHAKCGHKYEVTPDHFLGGRRCPKCAGLQKRTTKEFTMEVAQKYGNEYEVIGEYTNSHTKISIKHTKCNSIWDITPANLLSGNGCPFCASSKGEKSIRKYLRKNHIKYRGQYKIKECKNKKPLPFDFALFDKDKLMALVEYQGMQHYEPIEFFGGKESFEYQQKNDNIKRNYCNINNIPLIEIPYTVENIEEYLDKQLLKLNKPIQLALTK